MTETKINQNPADVSSKQSDVSFCVIAAVLLWSIGWFKRLGLSCPTAQSMVAATKASRSQAYALVPAVQELAEQLSRPRGRPKKHPKTNETQDTIGTLSLQLLDYLMAHPGCVHVVNSRSHYDNGFKRFVVELCRPHLHLGYAALSRATHIPEKTLAQWSKSSPDRLLENDASTPSQTEFFPNLRVAHYETIIHEWDQWNGSFSTFCFHVKQHLHIPLGQTAVASILEIAGKRKPAKRPKRSADEQALSKCFQTFFPNAQWSGDGAMVAIDVDGQRYTFNLELNVDTFTGAFVGANISDTEDSNAVIDAFEDAKQQTGTQPIAILLDNKPSNHTDQVQKALDDTIIIRATKARPQNKAHVEGAFGLLKPNLENILIDNSSPKKLAASVLLALVLVWARVLNHKPRHDRNGRSRFELLQQQPSQEEIENAQIELENRLRKQEKARKTQAQRQDPITRTIIADALKRLALQDPNGYFLTAIARYPRHVVVDAIAIFEGKQKAQTLPKDVDARYLLGITKNLADKREISHIAAALWQNRLNAQDIIAQTLDADFLYLKRINPDPQQFIAVCIDRSLYAQSNIERFFWNDKSVALIKQTPNHKTVFDKIQKQIAATFDVSKELRIDTIRFLAETLCPVP